MYWGNHGWWWGWGMGFGWLFMTIFWVLAIIGIIYLVRKIAACTKNEEQGETAFDILKKRYAKGEITKEEFDRIKDDLKRT
jgi:putative membrane protein